MNRVRCDYYKAFVQDNSGDQRKLFQATMKLLKPLALTTFPLHDDTYALANDFGRYFVKKMLGNHSIRTNYIPLEVDAPTHQFSIF